MPLKTVCTCCDQENCDGVLYVCTNCGNKECKTSIDSDFMDHGKPELRIPARIYTSEGRGKRGLVVLLC